MSNNASRLSVQKLRFLFDSLKPWHHLIYVHGVPTKIESAWGEPIDHPQGLWEKVKPTLPDLGEKRILDVGCNDGFFVFESRKLGAKSAVGIEVEDHFYQHATLVSDLLDLGGIEFLKMSAYDIDSIRLNLFNITFFLGVFYHLKNPMAVLERLSAVTTEMIIVESAIRNSIVDFKNHKKGIMGEPVIEFNEQPPNIYEPSPNWWLPNTECICAMLRFCGFTIIEILDEYILESPQPKDIFGRVLIQAKKGIDSGPSPIFLNKL